MIRLFIAMWAFVPVSVLLLCVGDLYYFLKVTCTIIFLSAWTANDVVVMCTWGRPAAESV